jgi:hypothetical protein
MGFDEEYFPPKRRLAFIKLHAVISQRIVSTRHNNRCENLKYYNGIWCLSSSNLMGELQPSEVSLMIL